MYCVILDDNGDFYQHPPCEVTYSPANQYATKFHCPGHDDPNSITPLCGSKPHDTPLYWVRGSVERARKSGRSRCTKCFQPS